MNALLALDLGSTSFRALRHRPGLPDHLLSMPLTPAQREGPRVSHDPLQLWSAIERLIGPWRGRLAMATQRSSFVLWDAATLEPVTDLVSWQDTRAGAWCSSHREAGAFVRSRTGLVLSPHYIGPKLASLWIERPDLLARSRKGQLRLGTLDTFSVARLTRGTLHVMDPTQAQRSSLWNLQNKGWDPELLSFFGIHESLLPSVDEGPWLHDQGEILCLLADQSAAALGLESRQAAGLVNLGTGGFVLVRTAEKPLMHSGLLLSHLGSRGGRTPWMAEGTINALASAFRLVSAPPGSVRGDSGDEAFCLPDLGAVGAPWWRPGVGPLFSPLAADLRGDAFRQCLSEGLSFRVREILESLPGHGSLLLSGGLSRDLEVQAALSGGVPRQFLLSGDPELTLRGLLRACGLSLSGLSLIPLPLRAGAGVERRFLQWKAWVRRALG